MVEFTLLIIPVMGFFLAVAALLWKAVRSDTMRADEELTWMDYHVPRELYEDPK